MALTNMGPTPVRAVGGRVGAGRRVRVGRRGGRGGRRRTPREGTHPSDDLSASADYRRHLATVVTERAVLAAAA